MKRLSIFIICLTIVALALPLQASTITKEFDKTVTFTRGGDVSVRSVNGKVEVTSWNRSDVEVHALIKVKAGSHRKAEKLMERVELHVEKDGDQLRIEGEYPKKNSGVIDWIFGDNANVTINYTIKVPKETNLKLRSTNGRVTAEDIRGDAELSTTNGSINAKDLKGSVDAHTVNGGVQVEMLTFDRDDRIHLNTTNGSVKLRLPDDVQADVSASTVNGSISTDFPLTVQGKFLKRNLNGSINGGGGAIKLRTVNGSISLKER